MARRQLVYTCLNAFLFFAVTLNRVAAESTVLPIRPVFQITPLWCWAAVGEMVFKYYGVQNINPAGVFQCGILALLHPVCNVDCRNCVTGASSLTTMNNMLTRYPEVASNVSQISTSISTLPLSTRGLTLHEVSAEIGAGRPVVAGISPNGYQISSVSEHVALIVGNDGDDLIVNDPFPFTPGIFSSDPYLRAGGEKLANGHYRISHAAFSANLRWRESIYRIRCRGTGCAANGTASYRSAPNVPTVRYGRSCRTTVGTCGPFFNQPALPLGAQCYCATLYGPASGQVVP